MNELVNVSYNIDLMKLYQLKKKSLTCWFDAWVIKHFEDSRYASYILILSWDGITDFSTKND